jgi:predicted O-methyltransferase YrrM
MSSSGQISSQVSNNTEEDLFTLSTEEYLKDVLAMNYLTPLAGQYFPWSAYALRPSGLVKILNQILINGHLQIVECGGGVSTLYIARLFQRNGISGHLYCIEHSLDWLNFLVERLAQENLESYVTLIYAPLKSCELSLENLDWYDTEKIRQQLSASQKSDCLLVDGPPAYLPGMQFSRFPAFPFFQDQFNPNATIVLDDINRSGEREILRRWQALLPISFYTSEGNVAIANLNKNIQF